MKLSARSGVPLLVFIALVVTYGFTLCPTVGPGDSGELTVVLSTWGVAHAPGYPLLSLIGNLVSHSIPIGEPALVLNFLNAVFAALACAVIAVAVMLATGSGWAGLVAGLALGMSRVFWLQALALEVFSLNALMAALLICLLCRFSCEAGAPAGSDAGGATRGLERGERARSLGRAKAARPSEPGPAPPRWTLPVAALVMSTALTHHLTLVLLALPAVVAFAARWRELWMERRDRAALGGAWHPTLLAAAAGLLPLLYIPIAAHFDPPLSWGDARDLPGIAQLLSRQDFGSGTLMSPALVVNQVLLEGERASPLGYRNAIAFVADLPRSLGWALPALAALGFVWSVRRSWPLALLGAGFLGLEAIFFARVNTPMLPLYASVTERFYILPHVVFAFFAGCGVAWLVEWARGRSIPAVVAGGAALLLTAVPMLALDGPHVSQRGNTFTGDFGRNLMAGMPERSIFFSTGDLFVNSSLYQRESLGRRRDVAVVDQDRMPLPWYVTQLRRRNVLRLPEAMKAFTGDASTGSRAWLDLNATARPALGIKFRDDSYRDSYRLLPLGIWSLVVLRDGTLDPVSWERENAKVVATWEARTLDRNYPEDSWEYQESIFYTYACGQLLGLRDLIGIIGASPGAAPPALETASRWSGRRAADLLAYRADFLVQCLAESLVAVSAGAESLMLAAAEHHARAALDRDPENLQALQTLAALLARDARTDPREQIHARERIVAQRPGDLNELVPYFRLVRGVAHEAGPPDEAIERRAEEVHARFVRLLGICVRLDPDPQIAALRTRWSGPLNALPELQ